MAAYVIASLAELKDPDLMSKYAETAAATVAAHGATRGGVSRYMTGQTLFLNGGMTL